MVYLFISPPFGNYFRPFANEKVIPITGSYTLERRSGWWMQFFKSVRYSRYYGGWVNKMGLRNPGLKEGLLKHRKGQILSLALLGENEIETALSLIPEDVDLELNLSCPNVEKMEIYPKIDRFLNPTRKWCIVKLSPNSSESLIDELYGKGFRQFHCSNTLLVDKGSLSSATCGPSSATCGPSSSATCGPSSATCGPSSATCGPSSATCGPSSATCGPSSATCGPSSATCGPSSATCGLSGPTLSPFTTSLVRTIHLKYPDTTIIAGGGIRSIQDAERYLDSGADHVSVSTLCFNLFMFGAFYFRYMTGSK